VSGSTDAGPLAPASLSSKKSPSQSNIPPPNASSSVSKRANLETQHPFSSLFTSQLSNVRLAAFLSLIDLRPRFPFSSYLLPYQIIRLQYSRVAIARLRPTYEQGYLAPAKYIALHAPQSSFDLSANRHRASDTSLESLEMLAISIFS
jgi:hypothetical protein